MSSKIDDILAKKRAMKNAAAAKSAPPPRPAREAEVTAIRPEAQEVPEAPAAAAAPTAPARRWYTQSPDAPAPPAATAPTATAPDRRTRALAAVRRHAAWSAGAAWVPVPMGSCAGTVAAQVRMIEELCALYDIRYTLALGKFVAASVLGVVAADGVTSWAMRLAFGVTGPLGFAVIACRDMVGNSAMTLALGRVLVNHLEAGGDLDASVIPGLRQAFLAETSHSPQR